VVGTAGEPAFANSWVNFGPTYGSASFAKDSLGFVHLKGTVKDGVAQAIFTLPVGYRPALILFVSMANQTFGYVTSGGSVQVAAGGIGEDTGLDGITFKAE
jgi:hypothetical protein